MGHGARAAIVLALVVAGATIGMLAAGVASAVVGQPAAPGLRANLLPQDLDGAAAPRIALGRPARGSASTAPVSWATRIL